MLKIVFGSNSFPPYMMLGWRKNLSVFKVVDICLENNVNNKTKVFCFFSRFRFHVWFGDCCCSAWQSVNILSVLFHCLPCGEVSQHYNRLWMLKVMTIIIFPFLCLFLHCICFRSPISERHCFCSVQRQFIVTSHSPHKWPKKKHQKHTTYALYSKSFETIL